MAGNQVSVGTSGMTQAASLFENAFAQTRSQQQAIESEIASLRAVWQGESAQPFFAAMDNWSSDFNTVSKQLGNMVEVMRQNAHGYDVAAGQVTEQASQLSAGLDGL